MLMAHVIRLGSADMGLRDTANRSRYVDMVLMLHTIRSMLMLHTIRSMLHIIR